MLFTKYLRDGVRSGEITTTVRVWQQPRVRVGKRYRMEDGEIEVDAIVPITFEEITRDLARACGFSDVADLLKVARHGSGENVYLIRFHYIAAQRAAEAVAAHRNKSRLRRNSDVHDEGRIARARSRKPHP